MIVVMMIMTRRTLPNDLFLNMRLDDEDFNNKYFVLRILWLFARRLPKDSRRSFVVHDTENVMQQVGIPRERIQTLSLLFFPGDVSIV